MVGVTPMEVTSVGVTPMEVTPMAEVTLEALQRDPVVAVTPGVMAVGQRWQRRGFLQGGGAALSP